MVISGEGRRDDGIRMLGCTEVFVFNALFFHLGWVVDMAEVDVLYIFMFVCL